MRFDLVLASTAARVRETLDGVAESYGEFDVADQVRAANLSGDPATLLELVRGVPDDVEAPLLVGHNPGLERLVARADRDDRSGLRERVATSFRRRRSL